VADLAFAFLRDRLATQIPGIKPRPRSHRLRNLLIGGGGVAGLGLGFFSRGEGRGLLPRGSSGPGRPPPPAQLRPGPPPRPANFPGTRRAREGPAWRTRRVGGGGVGGWGWVFSSRGKVRALLPGGPSAPDEPPLPANFEPVPRTGPSNYDAPGPVTNTATAV